MNTDPPARRRPLRADARRNYDRLLAEAGAAFAEHGTDFALEKIARRAGVANGTLYGHFPNRRALLEALLGERMRALAATGEQLLDQPEPFESLATWARAAVVHASRYRGLGAALMASVEDETSELHAACQAVLAAGDALVARARDAGEVREDVTALDLFALVNAAAWTSGQSSPQQGERLLGYALDGLRSPTGD